MTSASGFTQLTAEAVYLMTQCLQSDIPGFKIVPGASDATLSCYQFVR
jgi:hypothetical protein